MAEQYLHKYELEFGQPISFYSGTGTPFQAESTTSGRSVNSYMETPTDSALKLTEHNITFNIDKSKDAGKESTITIYNISDNTRKFLESVNGNYPAILLRAGYKSEENIPIIFQGEVINCSETFQGHTRITTLMLKSGSKNMKEAYTVRSYRAGTSLDKIFEDTIKDLKLPKGTIYYPQGNDVKVQVIDKPVVIAAPSRDYLRRLAKEYGYKFWIEDGVVNILPNNYVQRAGEFVIKISASVGNMIGSPTSTEVDPTMEKQSGVRQNITVKTTLNGAYVIGNRVSLESKFHNGVYEIEGINHQGTFESGDWNSTLQLKPVDGWEERS